MKERRKFVRVKGLSEVSFKVKDGIEGKRKIAVKDLSFIGINVYTDVVLKNGVIVELELDIPDGCRPLPIEGTILWQLPGRNNRFATGVRFNHTNDSDNKRLSKFIYDCASRVDETREFIRCNVKTAIIGSYLANSQKKINGSSIDISRAGMKLILEQEVASEDSLVLNFKLPGVHQQIELEAKVVWANKCENKDNFEAGLLFTKLNETSKSGIWAFIEDYCRLKRDE
ncbi:MAG: PilZ domain-containing protein [Candidatus Omnitrophica bacterium]|nr:PilZ domain-containing protein [Candidatus Omnitrophota bacterium]